MKTMKTTAIFLMAMVISNLAFGTGNLRVNVSPLGADNAIVNVSNTEMSNLEIEVRDLYGELIFFKQTKDAVADYRKKYDFSALDDGTYDLMVKTDTDIYENRYKLERGNIEILKESKTVKPYFNFEDNIFKMSYLNFDENKLKMYVYSDDNLLIEKKLGSDFAVNTGLDFSNTFRGTYKIVLEDDMNMFEYYVTID